MAKVIDCGLKISQCELLFYYSVHFWTNNLEPSPLFPSSPYSIHFQTCTLETPLFPLKGCEFELQLYYSVFVAASHQTRLDTRSKARRPIKVGIKGRGRSGRSRDSNPACLCCSSAHLVQCEPDEASSFTNPNVGPGTYASLRLKLDAWSSAVQRGQKCSSAHPKVAQPKLGAYSAPSLLLVSNTHPHECQTGPS